MTPVSFIYAYISSGSTFSFSIRWKATLPTISPTIFYVLITGFIGTLQAYSEFDLIEIHEDEYGNITNVYIDEDGHRYEEYIPYTE